MLGILTMALSVPMAAMCWGRSCSELRLMREDLPCAFLTWA